MKSRSRSTASKPTSKKTSAYPELVSLKLQSSGLTDADGHRAGMRALTPAETTACDPAFDPVESLCIPYHDPRHTDLTPLSDWPCGKQFYRLRYLGLPAEFTSLTTEKKTKYVQPAHTRPVAYYPPHDSWPEWLANVDQPLLLTEGELKAIKATKEGFPTIGLGGVQSWRAMKHGIEWIDSLQLVTWLRRNIYICFDSDLTENPNVAVAANQLGQQLEQLGAYPHLIAMPPGADGSKQGLDDFLTAFEAQGATQLRHLLHQAMPLRMTNTLFTYNARYAYVKSPGLIVEIQTRRKYDPAPFTAHVESKCEHLTNEVTTDGEVVTKRVSAAQTWIKWPLRHDVDEMTYQPGCEQFIEGDGRRTYNLWPGWGVLPKKGPVDMFLTLVDHLFSTAEPAAKQWFLQWCAYPLQNPGIKLFSSVVIHGRRHGTGKSLIGYTLGRIYGKNFTEINQADLHGSFNEWAEGRQFVLGDDVTGSNKRQEGDVLKKLITQRELRVNAKYMPSYIVPDCINYYFTSNHPDAFFLEDDDRRFFIHEIEVDPLDEAFYAEYDLWLDGGGSAAVFEYLLKLSVDSFNPAAPAYRTQAKERMIADGQSDLGAWVRQLLEFPDHVLHFGGVALRSDCFTSKELLALYDPSGRTQTTANGLSRELRRAGAAMVHGGKVVVLPSGSAGRYYAIRKKAVWMTAPLNQILKHLSEAHYTPPKKF